MPGIDEFCGKCGCPFNAQGYPKTCAKCQNTVYGNPTPVAVLMQPVYDPLNNRTGMLLIERGIGPIIGGKAMPGGFVDRSETAEIAAARELLEETGLIVSGNLSVQSTAISPQNNLLIFCVAEKPMMLDDVTLHFQPTNEALSFSVAWVPETLCFSLHTEALKKWFDSQPPKPAFKPTQFPRPSL